MIRGSSETLDWLKSNMSSLHGTDCFYIIVDFDANDYYKISSHRIGHSYSMFELLMEINVTLWGGSGRRYEAHEDYQRTIFTYKAKYHRYGENVRIAILKVTENSFILDEYFDIK